MSLTTPNTLNIGSSVKIFLSHSSKDKAFVRRLNKDLQSHNFDTWLDHEKIPLGASISTAVESAVEQSDILLIVLSRNSIASGWVDTEWRSKFFRQMDEKKDRVIPLLLNECVIPLFLVDRRYADFREADKYERNLSILLRFLNIKKSELLNSMKPRERSSIESVFSYTKELMDDLEDEYISLPVHKRLMIVDTLKKIPRSGKKIRLRSFRPQVRIRSIYDHVMSMAHVADCLLPSIDHDVPSQELGQLALCIAYHELNEVVLGDIPTYTSLTPASRTDVRIYAEEKLRSVPPKDRERIADEFIWMFLGEKHRKSIEAVDKILAAEKSPLAIIFKMLDKIDPIVATWRYLHEYRGKLGETPKVFNKKMKDFFENPDVKSFIKVHKLDARVMDLVMNLQDRKNAWDYYVDPIRIFGQDNFFQLPKNTVRKIIEGTPLFHTKPMS
jgi:5'-deoxynucleotidase YfbR-like HD superfamily hydrolase